MTGQKVIYTTSEVSKICRVSLSTVINWVNRGKLRAFETPGGHRRIKKEDLDKFLHAYNMPLEQELESSPVKRVLIVDDDLHTVHLLIKHIQNHIPHSKIKTAKDGFELGSRIISFQPDLVILNILLPNLDGFEVCRRIKSMPEAQNTKIAAITAQQKADDEEKVTASGADAYFVKPLPMDDFMARILQLLGIRQHSKTENAHH